ncbi:hypothetical protein GC176_07240 [bacterium]|nr:hypothetical protein [bacterium]
MKKLAVAAVLFALSFAAADFVSAAPRELQVHLAQAGNESPYVFVRAKFEPGELADPWSVKFVDAAGREVPYFVWDSMTWREAREGRADWGHRYAPLNHAAGDATDVKTARDEKIRWAVEHLPQLGGKLKSEDDDARTHGDSVCAAMYLLRYQVAAFGKQRLTLRIHDQQQVEPHHTVWRSSEVSERTSVKQGGLDIAGLPDRLSLSWQGRELFRLAGFDAGAATGTVSRADFSRPFTIEATQAIITKLTVTGETPRSKGGTQRWQSTYWLFPEGAYCALEGYSLTEPAGYRGGHQKLEILAPPDGVEGFTQVRGPSWDAPWYVHQVGDRGFTAAHLFFATPLTTGYGNNPFTVTAEGPNKEPRADVEDGRLALRWFHQIDDSAIARLMTREGLGIVNGHLALKKSSDGAANSLGWQANNDWLYRQYVLGVGEQAESAEGALRSVLGAASGWIDRPFSEEQVAALLVSLMDEIGRGGQSSEIGLLKVVSAVIADDRAAIDKALRDRFQNHTERTDFYIDIIRRSVATGMKPSSGGGQQPDGSRLEGWTGNPCYHAALMPVSIRTMEYFDLPVPLDDYRRACVQFADFGLELLGGTPFDLEQFRTNLEAEWPSRCVPTIPLMLHAYSLEKDPRYIDAARILFDDLMRLVERNPHGYFPAWSWTPQADKYDTVYNPVAYERGVTSLWSEKMLDVIGRDKATQFVAAQARWFVFSGQISDTFETDNVTAIRACNHGGHTSLRNQIGIYLHDDFEFYRGLVGELIEWSAATRPEPGRVLSAGTGPYRRLELSNAGSSMVRWALDMSPGSRWFETKVERLKPDGFRLQIWNRLSRSRPTAVVHSEDLGRKAGDEILRAVAEIPAYREPIEIAVSPGDKTVGLKVSKPVTLRLQLHAMQPKFPEGTTFTLTRRQADGVMKPIEQGVTWTASEVAWRAEPGDYELRAK